MTEKTRILDSLNERTLLLPSLVNMALAANDRVKYRFTLLQTAQSHAERPEAPSTRLRSERMAAGVQDGQLDEVVDGSLKVDGGRYRIPMSPAIVREALADVAEMLEPLRTAEVADAGDYAQRLQAFALPEIRNDELAAETIRTLTSGDRASGDSLHLLVMDMHRALNALQASLAGETIDGCRAYGIRDADRPLIAAFMAGVNRTAPLKFDHPGLSATATRVGDKLVLQNDIGTTDAHVLVVLVVGRSVTVTYTDVHLPRLLFFQSLFEDHDVKWNDTRSRKDSGMEDGVYHLCVGSHTVRVASSVTVAGTACTELIPAMGDRYSVWITNSAITTGTTATIEVTFGGSNNNCAIMVAALYGAVSSTPTATGRDASTSTPVPMVLSPTTENGAILIVGYNAFDTEGEGLFTVTGDSSASESLDGIIIDDGPVVQYGLIAVGTALAGSTSVTVTHSNKDNFESVALAWA
jgi:hypothetical protein